MDHSRANEWAVYHANVAEKLLGKVNVDRLEKEWGSSKRTASVGP
jgi:hypothetical protein